MMMKGNKMTGIVHDFEDGNGPVAAHQHSNGGGWVADTATVADTAFVGPNALVYGNAQVSGNCRVSGT
jgi:UDP-3-O-[3-hydroxymyristoyl] glucosamine N-acyltransferase